MTKDYSGLNTDVLLNGNKQLFALWLLYGQWLKQDPLLPLTEEQYKKIEWKYPEGGEYKNSSI